MHDGFEAVIRSDELLVGDEMDSHITPGRLGNTPIMMARLKSGEVVAFAATCPHQGTDLELAKLWDGNVRCSRHNYLYDPRTGENLQPTRDHQPENLWKLKPGFLPTYPVVERDGWVYVGPCNGAPDSYDPALEVRPAPVEINDEEVETEDEGQSETISVGSGQTFELRLPMSPLPGYEWQIEVEGPVVVSDDSAIDDEQNELVVHASAGDGPGKAFIRCGYSAPWDAEPSEFRFFEIDIDANAAGGQ